MKGVRTTFYTAFALTLLILGAVLVWKLLIRGERPGFIIIGLSAVLAALAALCLYSAEAAARGRGRAAGRLWLFIATLVITYAVVDIAGGAIFIRTVLFHNYPDKYVHHKMPPRMRYLMENPYGDYSVEMVTNNMGFRGRDIGKKAPGTYRIVMLGDSFTMGEGVEDASTFPWLTEEYLNGRGGRKYEVINLGVESYAPVLEYSLLKRVIRELGPDMVILNFDMSDLLNEYAYRRAAVFDDKGDIIAVDGFPEYERRRESVTERTIKWVRERLFITGILYETLNRRALNRAEPEAGDLSLRNAVERGSGMQLLHTLDAPQLPQSEEMYRMVGDSILRAKRLCDMYGCTFILSVYPWGHQVNDEEWVPGRYGYIPEGARISDRTVEKLGEFARENGIDFFNAFPCFREYRGGERLYFRHDMHWTPAGQRLMAKSLDRFIEKELGIKERPRATFYPTGEREHF
ncbi:MAG: SGNH/GDSL hydrolase family protein [Thermodesulfobacteriota bacterium]